MWREGNRRVALMKGAKAKVSHRESRSEEVPMGCGWSEFCRVGCLVIEETSELSWLFRRKRHKQGKQSIAQYCDGKPPTKPGIKGLRVYSPCGNGYLVVMSNGNSHSK
jgi:hypothetical protein